VNSNSAVLSRRNVLEQQQQQQIERKRQQRRRLQLTEFLHLGSSDNGVSSGISSSSDSSSSTSGGGSGGGNDVSGSDHVQNPPAGRLNHDSRSNRGGSQNNAMKKRKNRNNGVGVRDGRGSAESCFKRWRSSECRVEQV